MNSLNHRVAYAGIALPSVHQTILDYLYDHKSATAEILTKAVEAHVGKRIRLTQFYNKEQKMEGDPYALFMRDILQQMLAKKIIEPNGAGFEIGPGFELRKHLKIFGSGAMVFPPNERAEINRAASRRLNIRALAVELRPEGRGLRPLREEHVAELAESMRIFGYRPEQPVLVDQFERILSGRHRIAAAGKAGIEYKTKLIPVEGDLEALAIAWTSNECASWSKAECDRLAKHLGVKFDEIGAALGMSGRRALVLGELMFDPQQSDRAIAEKVGVDHRTVAAIRVEVSQTGENPQTDLRNGADCRKRPDKISDNENANSVRAKVQRIFRVEGRALTTDEVRVLLPDVHPQTVNSAVNALVSSGVLNDTGQRRNTRDQKGGRPAAVYALVRGDEQVKSKALPEWLPSAKMRRALADYQAADPESRAWLRHEICRKPSP